MASIMPGYNYDTRLRLSYGGHVFISYRLKKEDERGRRFKERCSGQRKLKTEIKYNTFCNKSVNGTRSFYKLLQHR